MQASKSSEIDFLAEKVMRICIFVNLRHSIACRLQHRAPHMYLSTSPLLFCMPWTLSIHSTLQMYLGSGNSLAVHRRFTRRSHWALTLQHHRIANAAREFQDVLPKEALDLLARVHRKSLLYALLSQVLASLFTEHAQVQASPESAHGAPQNETSCRRCCWCHRSLSW